MKKNIIIIILSALLSMSLSVPKEISESLITKAYCKLLPNECSGEELD